MLALGSSITYTFYILGGSRVLRKVRGDVAAFYVMGAAALSFAVKEAVTGAPNLDWTYQGWLWVAMITLVCTIIAITTFFLGLSRIGPSRAALISLLEPVTSVIASLLLFGNALSVSQWFGGIMILLATALTTLYANKKPKPPGLS